MGRKNILIVDTDKNFLRTLREDFSPYGELYQLAFAVNTSKAEEMLDKFTVHLVITNTHLSGESGIELLLNIRRWHSETHVILYCKDITEELKRAAYHSGAAAVLNQPFSIQDLLSSLNTIFTKEKETPSLAAVSLSDLIQLHAMGDRSSNIVVTRSNGKRGIISISNGLLVEAEVNGIYGAAAIAEMLSWQEPDIRSNQNLKQGDVTGKDPLMQVLLQAVAMLDENSQQ